MPASEHTAPTLAADLPFEAIPTYPILKTFARHGKLFALAVALLSAGVGYWAAQALGTFAVAAAGLLVGIVLGLILLVLAELTRALTDIMLPR